MTWIKDIVDPKFRLWEGFYRNRWEHDAVVRSTHGVNCTGGCSWMVYVKEGIVSWEMQALDYPKLEPSLPGYEPRGCQRGITFSWYVYSPLRVKYPYMRGALMDLWREARTRFDDPVAAWASIVDNEVSRRHFQEARGKGGLRRATWDECLELIAASMLHTARRYGPDRVIGFSPIPAMSMISYAAGSRLLQLFGAPVLSFYDMYADFPPASPETWGEKTEASESADWFNAKYIVAMGSNLSMTRTPDVHFVAEARNHGAKFVVMSPDYSDVSKYADWWLPAAPGSDGAFWMAVDHVLLEEFHWKRQVPYFSDYLKRYCDAPFLVTLDKKEDVYTAGRFVRANQIERYANAENGDWKCLLWDAKSNGPRMPLGSVGHRWQEKKGEWNLELRDGADGAELDPLLTFIDDHDAALPVEFLDFTGGERHVRNVPVHYVETTDGKVAVTTSFDLLMAHFGVARGLGGEYPASYDDADQPYTPAWQERFTGIGRDTVIRFAREWGATAEATRGKCMVIVGSGVNHWYHSNLNYRTAITGLLLCGCVGVNGGGLNHYTGQEKLVPAASWSTLAMALDWARPPRLQNGPSFHYVHSDQWRYESTFADYHPPSGRFAKQHTMDFQADAVRMGWLPFYPQFDRNPLDLAHDAARDGAHTDQEIVDWTVDQIENKRLSFAVTDPDQPMNWPRVWIIWRANALLASAKGHEYILKHYLGTHSNAIANERARDSVHEVAWREPAPVGKLDLVVDINFRMDTSALYSDIVLPAATWYEKDDLNTTDLHSYIHPLGKAVPPCWESRSDWDTFKALAKKISELAGEHFPEPVRDVVSIALQHDTRDEIAQPSVKAWFNGETEAVPGKTMPHLRVVERDYASIYDKFVSLGPLLRKNGVEDHAIDMHVADIYDEFARRTPSHEFKGERYPSLEEPADVADAILTFAPETNGEVSYRGFKVQEEKTGQSLLDLAEANRATRYDFLAVTKQPRRILTSPCWAGITNDGRAYTAYAQNVERLIPWRTLTGRQHLYLDHEAYLAFGESLPTFKGRIDRQTAEQLIDSRDAGRCITLNYLTPHGKWHIHSTYSDDLPMLSLSRGLEPFWLNDRDADDIGVQDDDWVEAYNDNGVVVTRAAVSARLPRGICFYYHAPERTVNIPKSPMRGNRRAGGHNSLTRLKLKPVLMAGGYAQFCYRFNDYGPPATDRDTWVIVHKLEGEPRF